MIVPPRESVADLNAKLIEQEPAKIRIQQREQIADYRDPTGQCEENAGDGPREAWPQ